MKTLLTVAFLVFSSTTFAHVCKRSPKSAKEKEDRIQEIKNLKAENLILKENLHELLKPKTKLEKLVYMFESNKWDCDHQILNASSPLCKKIKLIQRDY